MPDEYIKREDVLSLKHRLHNHSKDTIELYPVYVISPDAVEKIPSADVQPVVHGEWVALTENAEPTAVKCSVCGKISCCKGRYCPDCGAKMDKEQTNG